MNKTKLLQLAVLASAITLTACGSKGGAEAEATETVTPVVVPVAPVAPVATVDYAAEEKAFLQANNVVYFDYDKSDIREDARRTLSAHVAFLVASDATVMLAGHTDERGTREYNIALGERRAKSVESYLKLRGVKAGQLQTTSYGKERLVSTDHALNRRVEINYLAW